MIVLPGLLVRVRVRVTQQPACLPACLPGHLAGGRWTTCACEATARTDVAVMVLACQCQAELIMHCSCTPPQCLAPVSCGLLPLHGLLSVMPPDALALRRPGAEQQGPGGPGGEGAAAAGGPAGG